jgi:hypothetical protein
MAGSLIVPPSGHEDVSLDVLNRGSERVGFFRKAQLLECFVDSTEWPKKIVGEMKVGLRVVRVESLGSRSIARRKLFSDWSHFASRA